MAKIKVVVEVTVPDELVDTSIIPPMVQAAAHAVLGVSNGYEVKAEAMVEMDGDTIPPRPANAAPRALSRGRRRLR